LEFSRWPKNTTSMFVTLLSGGHSLLTFGRI
jgi:hypothetical protein